MSRRYLGKFRGTVEDNADPLLLGRVSVRVADVTELATPAWAMPCVPFAGVNAGILALPAIGAGVWVEFEQGDPDRPIWVGGFWRTAGELPSLAGISPGGGITLQTPTGNGVVISDAPGPAGGIRITTDSGATISVGDHGIVISNGKGATISLTGPTTDVNAGALTVT